MTLCVLVPNHFAPQWLLILPLLLIRLSAPLKSICIFCRELMYEDACASRKLRCDGHRRRVDTAYFHSFTTQTRGSITTTFGLLQHSAKPPFPLPDAIVKHQPGTRAAGHLDSRRLNIKLLMSGAIQKLWKGRGSCTASCWIHAEHKEVLSVIGDSTQRIQLLVLV